MTRTRPQPFSFSSRGRAGSAALLFFALVLPIASGAGCRRAETGPNGPAAGGVAARGNLFAYDATDKQYIFTLETKALTAGTWSIKADLGDGVTHAVNFTLTR